MARRFPSPLRRLLPVLAGTALLAGCGGGEAPGSTADSIGVLSDSPVKGVSYRRNATEAGQTDALGQFRYQHGENLEFRIGKLVIGSLTGSGGAMTVTPIELAQALPVANRANRVTNLLVLLQALDVDGDPSNGIDIPAAAVALLDEDAEIAKLDLDAAPATFQADTDLDAIVTAINTAGGSATKPTTAAALAHFKQEFLAALAGNYIGDIGNNAAALRFRNDGSYLIGEIGIAGNGGTSGLERGSIDWDPATGEVTINATVQDTNGSWGFNYIQALPDVQFRVDAGDLVVSERNASGAVTRSYRLARHYNSSSSLAGTWVRGNATSLNSLHLFLRSDGLALVLNPDADQTLLRAQGPACASAGVEFGLFTVANGLLGFSGVSSIDTDGCGGVHDSGTGAHFLATLTSLNYTSSMGWGWTSLIGPQSATLYRPTNILVP